MEPGAKRERENSFPAAFAVGVVVVLIVVAGFVLLTRSTVPHKSAAESKLPFGTEEQSYAANIHLLGIEYSQSENLLNQEFTYATGKISNDGNRPIRALELTVEFHDQFNQVVLREAQRVIDVTAAPLPAGQQRDFQVTIQQHIPSTWNQQYPSIRVTGLVLQ